MTAIVYLDKLVRAACPGATGISIGRWQDKTTWHVQPEMLPKAEKDAAEAIFAAFNLVEWKASQPLRKTLDEKLAALDTAITLGDLRGAVKDLLKPD
jgi:hypothetical protein